MVRLPAGRGGGVGIPAEAAVGAVWVGTCMAMIYALPPLGIFLGVYFWGGGELVVGAVLGFGAHFAILAASGRISAALTRVMGGGGSAE